MSVTLAVDAMGGDHGIVVTVPASTGLLAELPDLHIRLVGNADLINQALSQVTSEIKSRITVVHASEVVTMDDSIEVALRKKKDSSMRVTAEQVKEGLAQAAISAGNTGALMAGGTLRLRTMSGITRPALAAVVPRQGGHFVLIDAGANPEATSEHLVHNAILGSHYCRVMLGIERPRVGLMTIGTEEGKGTPLITETNDLLRRLSDVINYAGPIEGFHVFAEHVDVVVCDGFVGNIMIKSWESLVRFFSSTMKEELKANPLRATGALLSKGAFDALKERINPERYGGAPLLGLKGNIFKAHGSSNRRSIRSAIIAAHEMIRAEMNLRIEADVARANALLAAPVAPAGAN